MRNIIRYTAIIMVILTASDAIAQNKKVTLNGTGRSIMLMDKLGGELMETDTTSFDRSFNGYALLDLDLTIRPNKVTQIEAIFRLRNEFGGFWGAGVTVDVRKLFIEGLIKEVLRYRVGDFNLELTPYTLINPQEDGMVNEAEIFTDFKHFHYYDNYYEQERWRFQGLQLEFALNAEKGFKQMEFMTFLSRTRGAALFSSPEQYYAGAHWAIEQSDRFNAAVNYVNLFDIPSTISSDRRFNNGVLSIMAELKEKFGETTVKLNLEGGQSSVVTKFDEEAPEDFSDTYIDVKVTAETKPGINASIGFKDVGPDFFSAGAQSRRVDYITKLDFFPRVTNDGVIRTPTLFDYTYEEVLYNQQISLELDDDYPQKYNTTNPYGEATPNRRGVYTEITYDAPDDNVVEAGLRADIMSEIIGEGTAEKKSFILLSAKADFNLHEVIGSAKDYIFTVGIRQESSNRSGSDIEQVDLVSTLIDFGAQVEIFNDLYVVAGLKYHRANGSEYAAKRDPYNQIFKYDVVVVDDKETLLAAGLKYTFSEHVFASVQYVNSSIKYELFPSTSYSINRVLTAFHMKF
ncbi:MAG: hypothetical protein HKN92_00560 [Chitinophagales bacterium]|nr:hypothetical protein [Chitinophagales bacterium]